MTQYNNPPAHFGTHNSNRELQWLPPDTKERYQQLIQDSCHRDYFAEQGWDQPGSITYRINSHGFRADEFNSGPYLVALGCSYTVGIGLPDSATWARQTATALGVRCANLGWGGYSADSCYRLAEYWIPKLQPVYVCMLTPPRTRLELLLDDKKLKFEVFIPGSQSMFYSATDQYLRHWYLNEENAHINHRKNVRAVQQICADLSIPYTVLDSDEHMCLSREEIDYARDYMHGGPGIHKTLADKFVAEYYKLQS